MVTFPELRKISYTSFSVYCLLTTPLPKKVSGRSSRKRKGGGRKEKKKGKERTAAPRPPAKRNQGRPNDI